MTSASRYLPSTSRYQNRSSMYIQGLIPRNSMELAEAVPIGVIGLTPLILPDGQSDQYKKWVSPERIQNACEYTCGDLQYM